MRFGIVVYDDVEPIDIGATFGVLSMARRIEPAIEMFLVAARAGSVRLAGGLEIDRPSRLSPIARPPTPSSSPEGRAGSGQAANPAMLGFLRGLPRTTGVVASVCTGAMILAPLPACWTAIARRPSAR